MQPSILKVGRFAIPAIAVLALGACFPSSGADVAVTPTGVYGGTVVAYPAPGYYSPYGYGYGYGSGYGYYDDFGLPFGAAYLGGGGYGYGYAPYLYAYPQVIVRAAPAPAPGTRYAVPRGQATAPSVYGQFGLRSGGLGNRVGTARAPLLFERPSAAPRAQRFTMPQLRSNGVREAQPRPQSFNRPPERAYRAPPPPRQAPQASHESHRR